MPAFTVRCQTLPGRAAGRAARVGVWFWVRGLLMRLLLLFGLALAGAQPAHAQGVELALLKTSRAEGNLNLDFSARVALPKTAEDALLRGVPLYFVAEAALFRGRWYWRDERVSRVSRSWRVAYRPLTSDWRVSLAGLNQTYATLPEALNAASRSAGWRLADLGQIDTDKSYYVEFSYRLDTTQLPGPMQFGLGGSEWAVGVNRDFKVEP